MQADGAGTDPGWLGLLFIDLIFIKRTIVSFSCKRYRSGLDKPRDDLEGTATLGDTISQGLARTLSGLSLTSGH